MTTSASKMASTAGLSRIFFQPRLTTGIRFSFANHSATCASTGMARTSFATAASNACCWANEGAFFPWRARWIATRIARSIPGFSVIGAQARSVSGLVGIENFSVVVGRGGIEPRLKLAPAARNQVRELGGFHLQKRKHLAQTEFIQIEERQGAALRLGRRRNPDGQLLRLRVVRSAGERRAQSRLLRACPVRPGDPARSRRDNATGHREKTKAGPEAARPGRNAKPLLERYFEMLPAPCPRRLSSGNKSDRAAGDFWW